MQASKHSVSFHPGTQFAVYLVRPPFFLHNSSTKLAVCFLTLPDEDPGRPMSGCHKTQPSDENTRNHHCPIDPCRQARPRQWHVLSALRCRLPRPPSPTSTAPPPPRPSCNHQLIMRCGAVRRVPLHSPCRGGPAGRLRSGWAPLPRVPPEITGRMIRQS